jgi:hypothetical protein
MPGPVQRFRVDDPFWEYIYNGHAAGQTECLNHFLEFARHNRLVQGSYEGTWPGLIQVIACGHVMSWSVNKNDDATILGIQPAPKLP